MRVLLVTDLFQPEPNYLVGLAFAKRLMDWGHHVEVVTGFPNYPGGRLYDGYKIRLVQREVLDGVPVTRLAMYPSHDRSSFRRFLTYVTFALSAVLVGPFLFRRFDIVHVSLGPATMALPGLVFRFTAHAKLVLDVQDIWPESVSSSGMLRSRLMLWILAKWSEASYRFADAIIVLSNGYKRTICSRGAESTKIHVIYNWSDESAVAEERETPEHFLRLQASGKSIVLYAGNIGHVQALDAVIDAAELLQATKPNIHIAFVGDGVDVDRLKKFAAAKLLPNVSFFPRVEGPVMKSIFSRVDALLIHLRKDFLGTIGIPQKTQAYLAAGKPIVMAIDGEAADIVRAANAGIVCRPEDPQSIATAIQELFDLSSEEREAMGKNGQRYYRENLSFEIGLRKVVGVYTCALNGQFAQE
jgi:colanic acid biosynthesis glycosyl transferase WcaI